MKNPILRAFTQAAIEAKSAEELSARLNQTMTAQITGSPQRTSFLKKLQVDHAYGLTRPEWDAFAQRMTHPSMKIRFSAVDTGIGVMMHDPSTGVGFSFQPLYIDNVGPPDMIIVGHYIPSGALEGFTEKLREAIEADARDELGTTYSVNARHASIPSFDGFELMISRRGSNEDARNLALGSHDATQSCTIDSKKPSGQPSVAIHKCPHCGTLFRAPLGRLPRASRCSSCEAEVRLSVETFRWCE